MAELQASFNQRLGVRDQEKVQMAVRVGRAERAYAALRRDPGDFLMRPLSNPARLAISAS